MAELVDALREGADLSTYGVPQMYVSDVKLDLSKVEATEKGKVAWQKFLTGEIDNIFLSGSNGCGKTYAGCAIIEKALEKQFLSLRVTFQNVINMYTENGFHVPTQLFMPAFLFVDEVGKEVQKELGQRVLEEIVRTRVELMNKRTILATNMNSASFFQKYGPTIESDLKGYYGIVLFPQIDRRRK